jgi:hypothetical protein
MALVTADDVICEHLPGDQLKVLVAAEASEGRIYRFPDRARTAILVVHDDDGWLVLAAGHGWLHGDRDEALRDARWLAANYGRPVRLRTERPG